MAQRNLVTIYGISTVSYGFTSNEASDNLTKLAEETGGRVEYPLQNVYKDVAGFTLNAFRRRQFGFTGGHRRICVGGRHSAFRLSRQYRGRNHHSIYLALHSGRFGDHRIKYSGN